VANTLFALEQTALQDAQGVAFAAVDRSFVKGVLLIALVYLGLLTLVPYSLWAHRKVSLREPEVE
jgi:hypothetical protein